MHGESPIDEIILDRQSSQGPPLDLWRRYGLQLAGNGFPHPNISNAELLLLHDPRFSGRVWFDDFHQKIRTDYDGGAARDWRDSDDVQVTVWMQREIGLSKIAIDAVRAAIVLVAARAKRNDLQEMLAALPQWDGTERLVHLAADALGAEDTQYTRDVGANMLKAMVRRAQVPGAKFDCMVVLEGRQGSGKSSALEVLGGPYYAQLHSQFASRDAVLEIAGKWLVEVPELAGLSKRENEVIKAFLSTRVDRFRHPYGRHAVDHPRQSVLIGTTNDVAYLRDATGGRRYWPIRCGDINLEWLEINREQLFAEARHRLKVGESWWQLSSSADALREQEDRYEDDPWATYIEPYLHGRQSVSVAEVLLHAVKLDICYQDKRAQMRAAAVLSRAGWTRKQAGDRRSRVWVSPPDASGGSNVVRLKGALFPIVEPPEPPELPNFNEN